MKRNVKPKAERKHIVVIGGGTGTYTLLQGLKKYWGEYAITKIVSMADSGGSTGRLRDEMGQLPVGDARMGLAALAADGQEGQLLMRELLMHRFNKGTGLSGHNFGNLLLCALTEILGSEAQAIKAASRLLRIRGQVLPITEDDVHLVATYDNGVTVVGEHEIDEPPPEYEHCRIKEFTTTDTGTITEDAKQAIATADLIVLGPGDLYPSLLANCIIKGTADALQTSPAKFVYVTNLMSRPGQTRGMNVSDYLHEIVAYVGRKPDTVVINSAPLPEEALERYAADGDHPVEDDLENDVEIVRDDFLSHELVEQKSGDVLKRALIRHDGNKLAKALISLVP